MQEQVKYYHERAAEYERIYQKPERQADLLALKNFFKKTLAGQSVLEIACGTGYWTEVIAETATHILATDINAAVVAIAQTKQYPLENVRFDVCDVKDLRQNDQQYEALFGGFIWSHILREDLDGFLQLLRGLVHPGGTLLFVDNRFVAGSNTPISRTDANGNTYQNRGLDSGKTFEVVKNFPDRQEMEKLATRHGLELEWEEWRYYWVAKFRKPV